jgi:glycosyltransferase involved in cell wall biosynthesis
MAASLDVSVIICTRDRASSLDQTLTDLQQQQHASEVIEVIVVNNGSTDETESILAKPRPQLQMISLYEAIPGKSRALNAALGNVHGELIIFTDDDVSIGSNWVAELQRATRAYTDATIFCGPIYPLFPPETPEWLKNHPFNGGFFGRFDKQLPEGVLPSDVFPFGANFSVRRQLLRDANFRLDLGPSLENGALLGEDIDFVHRLRQANNECVYVPSASVLHRVRSEQLSPEWLFHRAFSLGRSEMLRARKPHFLPELAGKDVRADDESSYVEGACLIHYFYGQLSACTEQDIAAKSVIRETLGNLGVNKYADSLLPLARILCEV